MSIQFRQLLSVGVFIGGVLFLVELTATKACTQDVNWWVENPLVKVRPDDEPPSGNPQAVKIFAARNEFEPFQIVLHSSTQDVSNVDIHVSDLTSSSGGSISADSYITEYFEVYLNLTTPSSMDGSAGEWPDPLIPRIDRYFGERRNAFPFTLSRGRNQPLWIEVYVPLNTPPGTYTGQATITADQLQPIHVPITLTVWNFSLPSTSSLETSFGFNGLLALEQHRGSYTNDTDLRAITYLYAKAALWHRISIHGATLSPPPFTLDSQNHLTIDWTNYDEEVGPFLDGTVFSPSEPLYGAKSTSVDLRLHGSANTPELKVEYWKQWVNHFAEKGWLDRLFYYVWDEPHPTDDPQIVALGSLAHTADSRIRNLVTTTLDPQLENVVDIWAPLVNCVAPKPGFPLLCAREPSRQAYDSEIQRGKSLWWYQSCESHGCGVPGGPYFHGWPSYVIDIAGTANRIFPWISWKYNIQGELYFNMDSAYADNGNPWASVYLFGGNGDGTFFYPGRPDRIGGTTDIPIESIRLKLIREGLEDYEYLNLLTKAGMGGCVRTVVSRVVDTAYSWTLDPQSLYAARRQLGEQLSAQATGAGGVTSGVREQDSGQYTLPRGSSSLCSASE